MGDDDIFWVNQLQVTLLPDHRVFAVDAWSWCDRVCTSFTDRFTCPEVQAPALALLS